MKLIGSSSFGNPMTIRFRGVGTGSANSDWVYDYWDIWYLKWPNGIGEVAAIVGSVVRTMHHNGGSAKAGYVASFIAVSMHETLRPKAPNGGKSWAT
jgi:hypothetical protein